MRGVENGFNLLFKTCNMSLNLILKTLFIKSSKPVKQYLSSHVLR